MTLTETSKPPVLQEQAGQEQTQPRSDTPLIPRCSACNRFAIVEVEDNVFLCARCTTILKREFPNAGRHLPDHVVPASATAASESAPNAVADPIQLASGAHDAPQSGCQVSDARNDLAFLPDIPDFLDRRTRA